jgi:DNA-binding response OmpR family regulator
MNLLFIDDDKEFALHLAQVANGSGYIASAAYDRTAALDYARNTSFNAIFLSFSLAGADSREIFGSIRREGMSQHARIIAMVEHDDVDESDGLSQFDGRVVKPFRFDQALVLLKNDDRRR